MAKKTGPYKLKKIEIESLVKDTYQKQQQVKELEASIALNKQSIQKYFDSQTSNVSEVVVDNIRVQKIESAYISYNGFKLEKNLKNNDKKNLINTIIKKEYVVINIKAFLELIKLTAITPLQIKSHLQVNRKVDSKAVQRLFEKGDLTKEDLDDCMDSKIVQSIRFNEIN